MLRLTFIMLSYFNENQSFIGFLVKKHFYLYAVELISLSQLKVSIFYVEVPGILVSNEAIVTDHVSSGRSIRGFILDFLL